MPAYKARCRVGGETHIFLMAARNIRSAEKKARSWFRAWAGLSEEGAIVIKKIEDVSEVPELRE